MLDPCVPVVLLRIDRNPFHHGTLGAIRSLGRAGVKVHVAASADGSPVARSRYVSRMHAPPPPGSSPDEVVETLRQIAARIARPAVLIPMDDAGAVAVGRMREALSGTYLLPEQPEGLAEHVADKARLPELCRAAGIGHPEVVLPRSEQEAYAAALDLGLPVVAKWSRPWCLPPGSGLRSTCVVTSPEEARNLYLLGRCGGGELLLQKYLAAARGSDWFFHGYVDRHGRLHGGGAGNKHHAWPRGAGLTAVGRWSPLPELEALVERLVGTLGYRGIFDIDFRVDAETGQYCLLDFNPRPGAQFRLFADGNGLDVVRAQHLDLTHRPLPAAHVLPGRTFVVENYAPLSVLRTLLTRSLPLQRSAAAREFAWHARDDLSPAWGMATEWSQHAARQLMARARPAGRGTVPAPLESPVDAPTAAAREVNC
ncbi:ATP-grasp domain-containing protein [Streptomyces sp. VRA16 Mangrove soil]|uniref:carboxylate--amine ligase n=1 Tax=Streptomyces sp. VRA16 Mangrove soil TaxID=2817434 RepID=UPI001A9EF588|nr:ATP-grasp domain-containing protein [Streptomyces sp. VRA16 Mangrove soil]MBO1337404.1 ATP-grasp domain-containing protein [Streptomyces sp. VRA16 Mangrove soil]